MIDYLCIIIYSQDFHIIMLKVVHGKNKQVLKPLLYNVLLFFAELLIFVSANLTLLNLKNIVIPTDFFSFYSHCFCGNKNIPHI